ncbi:MAG: hypothetical protein PGN09_07695 [Sphingomonas fennica]
MAILTMPAVPGIKELKPTLRQPTQINRAEFTGKRRGVKLAAAPRWMFAVAMAPVRGEAAMKPWRAFLALCEGQAGQFRLPVTERPQGRASRAGAVVDGAGQIGYQVALRGLLAGDVIEAGEFLTIGGQLLLVTASAVVANGKATVGIRPFLWAPPADGSAVEATRPYAIVSMSEDTASYAAKVGQEYEVAFACEESR